MKSCAFLLFIAVVLSDLCKDSSPSQCSTQINGCYYDTSDAEMGPYPASCCAINNSNMTPDLCMLPSSGNYLKMGSGKCKVFGSANGDPAHQYFHGIGFGTCRNKCKNNSDCFGFSVSSYGNCLLWLQVVAPGGSAWGNADCWIEAGYGAASAGRRALRDNDEERPNLADVAVKGLMAPRIPKFDPRDLARKMRNKFAPKASKSSSLTSAGKRKLGDQYNLKPSAQDRKQRDFNHKLSAGRGGFIWGNGSLKKKHSGRPSPRPRFSNLQSGPRRVSTPNRARPTSQQGKSPFKASWSGKVSRGPIRSVARRVQRIAAIQGHRQRSHDRTSKITKRARPTSFDQTRMKSMQRTMVKLPSPRLPNLKPRVWKVFGKKVGAP